MSADPSIKHLCYNCFQEREVLEGPCPYCGFDLAENEKKFPVALRAGTVLNDRYIIGRVLGQGGFGITYLALDTQLNAKVAIKEFMPGEIATRVGGTTVSVMMDTKSEEFAYGAERFQEEARTLAKFIGNPNIAAVTSYFDENDTSYFVMDYIEGISFKTYIANHGGKISVEETLNVMIPVLRALTAVHAEGFIHRDVTPDNIYITKDGMVKLLDFGSARYSIGDKSKSSTSAGAARGRSPTCTPAPPASMRPSPAFCRRRVWSGWTRTPWSPSPSAASTSRSIWTRPF